MIFNFILHLTTHLKVKVKSLSCVWLCDPMDCSPPGTSIHGDSPGKNIGVDCHALLQGIFPTQGLNPGLPHCRQLLYHLSHQGSPSDDCRPLLYSVTQSCLTLCNAMGYSLPGSSVHGDSPGKYTDVGCHAILQAIYPTQGLNPGLPHCRWFLYHLSHQGSP